MELIIVLLLILIVLDIAALRWGKDSTDTTHARHNHKNILFPVPEHHV
jgi:hypothetical protein